MNYRFQLQRGSKKFTCPNCERKSFTRYADTETGDFIRSDVGRCDRLENCAYHFTPREYFDSTGMRPAQATTTNREVVKPVKGRLPFTYVHPTLNNYEQNDLIQWMAGLIGWSNELAEQTAIMYNVGTGKAGSCVSGWPIFWQVDNRNQVRSGKLIRYDRTTGKRIKSDGFNITWIHSLLQKSGLLPTDERQWSLDQCLFGLHLVQPDDPRPVAIVEGEKTALISSQYLPKLIWLSTGQLNGLNQSKLHPLKGRKIILFPDKGKAFNQWQQIADELRGTFDISVSDLLERKAPNEHEGYDLADYLIQFDIKSFKGSKCYFDELVHP